MHHTCIAVVGQNYGAKEYKRVVRSIYICMAITTALMMLSGSLMSIFAPQMVRIFSSDPEVIAFGVMRAHEMFPLYFILGFMDSSTGALRGLGNSLLPAISVLLGTCGLRILWVKYVFPHFGSMESLLMVYPVSWGVVALLNMALLFVLCYKLVTPRRDRWVRIPSHN
jgi:Na+-driven multidrug efflux pump